MKKMDSLVYTDSDSENNENDNTVSVRKVPRKPSGGQSLPGMDDNGAEISEELHKRSIGGHTVPRTLPSKINAGSEDDVFEEMDDFL